MSPKGGQAIVVTKARDLSWLSRTYFVIGEGRHLAPLDGRRSVWVSHLFFVCLRERKSRPIVRGLVSVEEFDCKRKNIR